MKAIFTPTELNKTNHTPQATLSPGHTHTKHPARLRCALRRWTLLALLALTSIGIKAADYVFTYNNGYLAVDNNGNITYANTFNPQCIWTCVSNTGTLAGANLDANNSRFLYTTVGNTKYWLMGSTTNGAAITATTTAPGTAYWRNNSNRLYWNDGARYVYYRDNQWKTSNSSNPTYSNRNNVNYYNGYGTPRPDYRSTTINNEVKTNSQDNTTAPTISAALNSGNTGIQLSHTNVSGTYLNYKYTTIGNTTYYWLDGATTAYTNTNSLSANVDWSQASYEWSISSGGNYAQITSDGVLTSKGAATAQQTVTVKLTTTYPAIGYSNEQPFNISIQDYAATTVTAGIGDNNVINTLGGSICTTMM